MASDVRIHAGLRHRALFVAAAIAASLALGACALDGGEEPPDRQPKVLPAGVLIDPDVGEWPVGPVSVDTLDDGTFGTNRQSASNLSHLSVVGVGGNRYLQTTLSAGTVSGGGVTLSQYLPYDNDHDGVPDPIASGTNSTSDARYDQATLTYGVKFVNRGFDWGWGGKLPGLAGIKKGSPIGGPSGGKGPTTVGWSVRVMWLMRAAGYGGDGIVDRQGLGYAYGPTVRSDDYGLNLYWRKGGAASGAMTAFSADTWQTITMKVKLNGFDAKGKAVANGVLQMWLDGSLVYSDSKRIFRVDPAVHITHLYWHNFYGGSSSAWAPRSSQRIWFRDIEVTTP